MAFRITTGRNGFHDLEEIYRMAGLPINSQTKIDLLRELIIKARTTEQIEELRPHVVTLKKYENENNQKIKSYIIGTIDLFQKRKQLIDDNSGKLGPPEEEHIKKFFEAKGSRSKGKVFKKIKNMDIPFDDLLELFNKYNKRNYLINRILWDLLIDKAKTQEEKIILYNLSERRRRGELLKLDSFADFREEKPVKTEETGDINYWTEEFLKTKYKKRKDFCFNKILEAGEKFDFKQWLDIYNSHDNLALRKRLFSKLLFSTKNIDDGIILYKLLSIKRDKKKTAQKITKLINNAKDIQKISRKISIRDSIFYEISKELASRKAK
ncbi:MAG: hypothetical protein MCSN_4800 [Candidatus Microsyncoccus archaeolyticus]|nr:MAG: hypothetical protein MCSN_4800 [Candidatus Parcubacteria bacterium]